MRRFVGTAGLVLLAGLLATPIVHAQGAQSPYDTLYLVLRDTTLRAAPEGGSALKAPVAKGTEGVIMRWCRPEFNFRDWAYGSLSLRRSLLKPRICEVEVDGMVGFLDAKFLDPM